MGGVRAKAVESEVMVLPWSLGDLKYLVERDLKEGIDDRRFQRWRKVCLVRGPVYRPFDLAKLVFFGRAMRRFGSYAVCRELLAKDMKVNVEFWDWAKRADARDWASRSTVD